MTRLKTARTGTDNTPSCQVCGVDLAAIKANEYCQRRKVCPQHRQADSVWLPGMDCECRFCHQCGRFEPLSQFDGIKRSCRSSLVRRRKPPQTPAPDSHSGNTSYTDPQNKPHAAPVTADMAAGALGWCSAAAHSAACSAVNHTADMEFLDYLLGVSQPAGGAGLIPDWTPTADVAGQQQQHVRGIPDACSCILDPSGSPEPGSTSADAVAAAMEQELQRYMLEQQQHQQLLQPATLQADTGSLPKPAVAQPEHVAPGQLSTEYTSSALQDPAVPARTWNSHSPAAAGSAVEASSASDNSSHSDMLPGVGVLDCWQAAQAALAPTHHAADTAASLHQQYARACEHQQLSQQMQDLLDEEKMLQQRIAASAAAAKAATTASGMPPVSFMPSHHTNTAALPSRSMEAAALGGPMCGGLGVMGMSPGPAGAFGMSSGCYNAAVLPTGPGDALVSARMLHATVNQQQQHREVVAVVARQQEEAVRAQRMQHLQAQFFQVSAQLSQLRHAINTYVTPAASSHCSTATAFSLCAGHLC